MEYCNLGHTGMQVSSLCLGAMMFGAWGEPDHDESIRIILRALDEGINFIDTADVYSQGESEEIVGKALKGRRDDVIVATKFHAPMDVPMGAPGGDPNKRGNSRRWIMQEVEHSLRRLQTDWIDLYQVHRPDTGTDDDETIAALTDLQHAGTIRAFGSSTFPAYRIVEGQWISERRGLGRFICEQPPYSLLDRGSGARRAAGRRALSDGCDPMEPAQRGMADRAVPQGPRSTADQPRTADARALRPVQPS